MKTQDVKVGSVYSCKVNGRKTRVSVEAAHSRLMGGVGPGQRFRKVTDFTCRSLATGRTTIKTARSLTPVVERTTEQDMTALIAYTDPLGAEPADLE